MIGARHINLYRVHLEAENVDDDYALVGFYSNREAEALWPKYHIEDCVLEYANPNTEDDSYAINLGGYAGELTVKNTTINGTSTSDAYGILVNNLYGPLTIENTDVNLTECVGSTKAIRVAFCATGKTARISDSSFHADCIGSETNYFESRAAVLSSLNGSPFEITNCNFTASSSLKADVYALEAWGVDFSLSHCTVMASNSNTYNSGHQVYGINMTDGSLILTDGCTVSAENAGTGWAEGIYYYDGGEDGKTDTLSITGSTVSGEEYGVYVDYGMYAQDISNVNILNSSILADTENEESAGLYFEYRVHSNVSVYLGGETKIVGGKYSMNTNRENSTASGYTADTPKPYRPRLYAYSMGDDPVPLSIGSNEQITLYVDTNYNEMMTGDPIVAGGMTESLVGKLDIIRPDVCSIGADGKVIRKTEHFIYLYDATGGTMAAYSDPEYKKAYEGYKAYNGKTIYIKAIPETHYAFKQWKTVQGVTLDNAVTVA